MLSLLAAVALAAEPASAASAPSVVGALGRPPPSELPAADKPAEKSPYPKTPPGVAICKAPLMPAADLPRASGETIRYLVDVNGLSVGTIDFKIEKRGTFGGKPVTEYRSLFKLDALVSTLVPVEGRAAALVPEATHRPLVAMNHYTMDKNEFDEIQTFAPNGKQVSSKRTKNGKESADRREYLAPMQDFVSAFYVLRRLPAGAEGCAIIYGNQKAYTVWIKSDGREKVKTPVGMRTADRYALVYGSDKGKKLIQGRLWLGEGPDRLPYRAELDAPQKLEARIHLFESGAP